MLLEQQIKGFSGHNEICVTAKSKFRGYNIEYVDGAWRFCDTSEPVDETHFDRPCGHCGKRNTEEGHDGCLNKLPGLMNACCGHGKTEETYIQFLDGAVVSGISAKKIIAELKKYND